jgi:PKHD-type hydroxylase
MKNIDYWYIPKFFSYEELVNIHNIFEQNTDNEVFDIPAKDVTKKAKVYMSHWYNFKHVLNSLDQSLLKINQDNFGFNIWPQYDANIVRLNEYDSAYKGEYDWHVDGSTDDEAYDIKFTLLLNASLESYEGGKFYLFTAGATYIDKLDNPGDIVIFKSYIPHCVSPVTKGKRHSMTLFYNGPKFQ